MTDIQNILAQVNAARTITTAVAPAILVSAGGLMLLGLQNKFHNITDRIRQLDREIIELEQLPELNGVRRKRLANAERQVDILLIRGKLVRDAIFFLYVGVMLLIGSTLAAAFGVVIEQNLDALVFVLFVAAVITFLCATVQSTREVLRSFRVIEEEVEGARDASPLREPKGKPKRG
jgi:hypothetical protein